jgi:hypothetical protein
MQEGGEVKQKKMLVNGERRHAGRQGELAPPPRP